MGLLLGRRGVTTPFSLRWSVIQSAAAELEYSSLSPVRRYRIKKALESLEAGPLVENSKLLDQYETLWSLQVDRWRIVYDVYPDRRQIVVRRIRPRKTAYEDLLPRLRREP